MLSTSTKVSLGTKAAKRVVKNQGMLQVAAPVAKGGRKLARPWAKRRARKRVERFGESARAIAMTLATYGPDAARALGILPPKRQKQKLVVPVAAAGAVLGAGAIYGATHRAQLLRRSS